MACEQDGRGIPVGAGNPLSRNASGGMAGTVQAQGTCEHVERWGNPRSKQEAGKRGVGGQVQGLGVCVAVGSAACWGWPLVPGPPGSQSAHHQLRGGT